MGTLNIFKLNQLIFIYDNENIYSNLMNRHIETQWENYIDLHKILVLIFRRIYSCWFKFFVIRSLDILSALCYTHYEFSRAAKKKTENKNDAECVPGDRKSSHQF